MLYRPWPPGVSFQDFSFANFGLGECTEPLGDWDCASIPTAVGISERRGQRGKVFNRTAAHKTRGAPIAPNVVYAQNQHTGVVWTRVLLRAGKRDYPALAARSFTGVVLCTC